MRRAKSASAYSFVSKLPSPIENAEDSPANASDYRWGVTSSSPISRGIQRSQSIHHALSLKEARSRPVSATSIQHRTLLAADSFCTENRGGVPPQKGIQGILWICSLFIFGSTTVVIFENNRRRSKQKHGSFSAPARRRDKEVPRAGADSCCASVIVSTGFACPFKRWRVFFRSQNWSQQSPSSG